MSKSNDNVVEFFNNFSKNVNGKNILHIFNPFYNYYPLGFERLENHCITQNVYGQPYSYLYSLRYSIICLIKNIYHLICRMLVQTVFSFINSIKNKTVYGTIKKDTEYLFYTWVLRKDLKKHLLGAHDYIWNRTYEDMAHRNKIYQIIVVPLFKPTKDEIDLLLKLDRIVVLPYICNIQAENEYFFAIFSTLPKAFKCLRRLDWFMAYVSTMFSLRAISALEIYNEISKIINGQYTVILPWESQPEQKALCSAFREKGSKVFGYIHSGTTNIHCFEQKILDNRFELSYPETIFTHSLDSITALAEVGWNRTDIRIIRTVRYDKKTPGDFYGKMYLPYTYDISQKALLHVQGMLEGGLFSISEILLHPFLKENKELNMLIGQLKLPSHATDIVVVGYSTVILEALEIGCCVIQIVFEGAGDFDNTSYTSIKKTKIGENCYRLESEAANQNFLIAYTYKETLLDHIL